MSKVRGDDDLFSLMDEMSSNQGYGGDKEKTSSTSNKKASNSSAPRRRIRLISEIQGYPSNPPRSSGSRSIWNPYVASPISKNCSSAAWWFPPTNPCTEVLRRRAYEKFKLKFRDMFVMIASNQNQHNANNNQTKNKKTGSNDGFDVSKLWGEVSASQITERWHFGIKLLEMDKIREKNHAINALSSNYTKITEKRVSTSEIRSKLVLGRENCALMDPILVASGSYSGDVANQNNPYSDSETTRKYNQQTQQTNANILKSELMFEWKRTWRRKVKGKTEEEELDKFLSSTKFQKKVMKLSRDVRNAATEVEGQFWNELRKQASQEEYRTIKGTGKQGKNSTKNKQKSKHVPKLTLRDDGSICLTHLGLSFTINVEHYRKLQVLFDRFQPRSLDSRSHNEDFLSASFSLLARYDMLQGAGLQSSLHGAVFDVLLQSFDCRMECFASPLNCRYERYCSAFTDTDSPFGSLGSFFDFDFNTHLTDAGGCFQANPPFAADFIHAMHRTMEKAMEDVGTKPLMFIVFVPAWTETEGWKALDGSKQYLTKHVLLSQSSHYYCEGTQHRRKERYRVASFDSSVFFLQNKAAKEKWPVTDNAVEDLRAAFETNPEEEKDGDDNHHQIVSTPMNRAKKVKGSSAVEKIQDGGTNGIAEEIADGDNRKSVGENNTKHKQQRTRTTKKNKKKRKFVRDELSAGGNKEQLNILNSLGLINDTEEDVRDTEDEKPDRVKIFSNKKKRKNKKRKQQRE